MLTWLDLNWSFMSKKFHLILLIISVQSHFTFKHLYTNIHRQIMKVDIGNNSDNLSKIIHCKNISNMHNDSADTNHNAICSKILICLCRLHSRNIKSHVNSVSKIGIIIIAIFSKYKFLHNLYNWLCPKHLIYFNLEIRYYQSISVL